MSLLGRRRREGWDAMRARIRRETELYLEQCLRDPTKGVIIPTVRVGFGTFPRGYAHAFWAQILGTS